MMMGTTAEKLNYLQATKAAIKDAIVAKGVDVRDSDTFRSYADKIESIQGADVEHKDVNFYDYDGRRLYSYTKDEFLELTEMPRLPKNSAFVCQGWNWALDRAKTRVSAIGGLDIGALYGERNVSKFHLAIRYPSQRNVTLVIYSAKFSVEWGDGQRDVFTTDYTSDPRVLTHTYESTGEYVIHLRGSGMLLLGGIGNSLFGQSEANPNTTLVGAEFGYVRLLDESLANCHQLKWVTFVSNADFSGTAIFKNCYNLKAAVLPNDSHGQVYSFSARVFENCTSLTICVLGEWTAAGKEFFKGCSSLEYLCVPYNSSDYNNINEGYLSGCKALISVIIGNRPTSFYRDAFYDCRSLQKLSLSGQPPELPNLSNCVSLKILDLKLVTEAPDFTSTTFPTDGDYIIIVADDMYDSYMLKGIWFNIADRVVKASEYEG